MLELTSLNILFYELEGTAILIVEDVDNAIFVEEAHILNHAELIAHIPTVIVQGRYDVVCPTRSAWELHKVLPQSNLIIVADAGHSMGEVSIARELVAATDSVSE